MSFGEVVRSVADTLTSGRGIVPIAVLAAATIAAPVIDRYVIRRRRLTYRVLYNSKIGLNPITLHDRKNGAAQADPELVRTVRLLEPLSVVVIRIRNTGSFDIAPGDFEHVLQFTFGDRVVWDARVSEARDGLRDVVRDGLEFFTRDTVPEPVAETAKLSGVRALLPQRLSDFLRQSGPAGTEPRAPQWHGVRLGQLSLKQREKFKLVVVLHEPDGWRGGPLSKELDVTGRLTGGRIKDERKQRRLSWPVVTVAIGVLLTGALLSTLIFAASRTASTPGCANGTLAVHGSSAFVPIMASVATEYHAMCGNSTITTQPSGSVAAVRELGPLTTANKDGLAVLSDGKAAEAGPDLVPQAVAVLMYSLVVNSSAGLDRLTTDQVRGIFDGRFRDWAQLRPGPSLPIRIAGRGQESGTRRTFEQKVLGTVEPGLSSDDCLNPGRDPRAAVIRCERGTTAEVIQAVGDTPGAIGYADVPAAKIAAARGGKVTMAQLDGHYPDVTTIDAGYRFWTVEYLYTKGVPANDSLLKAFMDYLRSGTARAELQDAGYTPCITKEGLLDRYCTRPDA